jgi:signal transduction histidine kinase
MQWWRGRLFWRGFFMVWLAMVTAFACAGLYLHLSGRPPPRDGTPWLLLVPVLSAGTVALPVAFGLAWYLSKPVRHLTLALQDAARSRFDVRVLPALGSRRDEFTAVAHEFDAMAARLEQVSNQQRQLFHDVSHELRSPLARIQAAVGLMQQDPKSAAAMVDRVAREAARLDMLIEELLTLHKLEAGAVSPSRERVDIVELLADIVEDATLEARIRGCVVTLDAPSSFVAEIAGESLYRAIENVIRNAIKYTSSHTNIEVSARTIPVSQEAGDGIDWLEINVSDRGPGVPLASCEAIFEPFRRIESQQGDTGPHAVPGIGLGLAIARRAVALHGGDIRAMPREGGGLVVSLRVPRMSSK